MSANYKKLGDYITQRREKNTAINLPICGVCREGLIPPKQQDADISLYNVFYKNDFIFNPARMELNSITLNTEYDKAICSSLYEIFYINDTSKLFPEFLFVQLKTDNFVRFCEFQGQGSVREYCRFANISEYPVIVPDLKEQEKIVNTYNAITKRIQLKQKINENLSNQLSCLYEVLCSEEKSKKWKEVLLDEIIENKRNNIKVENIPNDSIYVGLEHIPRKIIVLNNHGTSKEVLSDKLRASKGDILFGKIRPYFHKVSVNPYDEIYCSGDALVFNAKQKELYGFILLTVFSEQFVNYAVKLSNGAKMPRAEWKDLKRYTVRVPNTQILNALNEVVNKSLEYIYSNLEEIAKLQELKQLVISRISGM